MVKKDTVDLVSNNKTMSCYGENVFNLKAMKKYLTPKAYKAMKETIEEGKSLPKGIEDDVAKGMLEWAVSKGADHYTHWFMPLTGLTAEKHDAFIEPTVDGGVTLKFTGKRLVQGEPDASSFPSGGIRATFEARGYTAWDPTSPAFIKYIEDGPTLCIPTAFASYTGEALDKKTPLLRSMEALSNSIRRLMKVFDGKIAENKAFVTLGPEQEYFLIDKEFYLARPDLIQTGRTLFGSPPPKHQQMEDHYFGAIRKRILSFMEEVDIQCWKLGIPAKTRHNEVAPAQFELAPVFEDLNLSVDHNMMVMQILQETADKYGLVCLLHEKPFAGINGSGKHNNWSISSPDGKNLMDPGENPHENAKFMTALCAVIKAVDKYAKLLRATVASAANDHRLGANEAPPAIISIFLGDQLTDIIEQIEKGGAKTSKAKATMKLGVTSMPDLPKDTTDRNRTSPFAFTGTKFEFRAVGSSQSCAGPNVVLNTAVAEVLDEISDELEPYAGKREFNERLQALLQRIIKEHKRIIFNGDNYTKEWENEAQRRGLPNIKKSDDALKALVEPQSIALFEKYKVLSNVELQSRYKIYLEGYERKIKIEGDCALEMVRTMYVPAALKHLRRLSKSVTALKAADPKSPALAAVEEDLRGASKLVDEMYAGAKKLESAIDDHNHRKTLDALVSLRTTVDTLELEVADDLWPVPKYRDMLHIY